jgi:hypothetical protein
MSWRDSFSFGSPPISQRLTHFFLFWA